MVRSSLFLTVGILLASSSSWVQQADAQQQCNGYAELCSRTYDKVSYPTAHNAYAFNPPNGLATNQINNIPTQLKDGIRAFMLDAYAAPSGNSNEIQLCHTMCNVLDGGPLSATLAQIKTFMDANPNEVITILWENAANLKPAQFQAVYAAAGLSPYLHAQAKGATAWPTLAQMISSKKRLVNFIDSGADATVPWLMSEYDFVFETPYNIPKGTAYPCTIDRPKDQRKQMYVLNHFISGVFTLQGDTISIPQPDAADQTNGPDLISHINSCQTTFKQIPSFVAVDFYQKGSLTETVAKVNKVTWNGIAATGATSGKNGTTNGGSGNSDGSSKGANAAAGSLLTGKSVAAGFLATAAGAIVLLL
ncbi:hypothetical protein BG015_004257 [Linnemannia schmuckeri]|uniref:PLC-like phosphodiesterase n=1 Tax=Linnemannia schmuckeri TaxID=64567 RepID=A0A9P5RDA4_9FUNG|nr:hypothetical protein BG015_004257 [Linnemannia schmuckeri]